MLSFTDLQCIALILILRIGHWHGWCLLSSAAPLRSFFLVDRFVLDDLLQQMCRPNDDCALAALAVWYSTHCGTLDFTCLRYARPLLHRAFLQLWSSIRNMSQDVMTGVLSAVVVLSRRLQGAPNFAISAETSGFYDQESQVISHLVVLPREGFSFFSCTYKGTS